MLLNMIYNNCNIERDLDVRYNSYPITPYWNNTDKQSSLNEWKYNLSRTFSQISSEKGISLYIHLPFCSSLCSFCSYNPYISKQNNKEVKYIDYLIKEWYLYLKLFPSKPQIKQLYLGGGTPTFFSAEDLKLLINTIFSTITFDEDSIFEFEAHVNSTTTEHLIELNKLGFKNINIGIQDFDFTVQKTINRVHSFEAIEKITKNARYIGYKSITYDMIYGLPFQSRKTAISNIYKIRELKPDRIRFSEYNHCPDKNPAQKKYQDYLPIELEKNAILTISKEMLNESGYYNIGMNNFVQKTNSLYFALKNKSLHRNMMGYTTQNTKLTIGLGASAFSDSWNATVQNERSLNLYYRDIDQKQLPIANGYFLNKEDNILRSHILNLQCKYETRWENRTASYNVLKKNFAQLEVYEKAKLLKISKNSIRIKKSGRQFIRDICTILDSRKIDINNLPFRNPLNEVVFGVKK